MPELSELSQQEVFTIVKCHHVHSLACVKYDRGVVHQQREQVAVTAEGLVDAGRECVGLAGEHERLGVCHEVLARLVGIPALDVLDVFFIYLASKIGRLQ